MRHAKEHFVFGVYLIEEESMIATFTIGTSCWIPYFNEISNDIWKDQLGVPLYLGKLAVKPSIHKRGIGKALMNKVDKIAKEKGCTSIRFDAIEKVPGLRYFYENCGYNVVGDIEAKDVKGTMNKLLLFEKCLN
jgi:GNAT superfamily N-acetyltransferase